MDRPLKGIFVPHMVPLDERGAINEPELRRYIDWLIERGVHGLYPNGSSGEFLRFTVEERRRITRIVCEQAAGRVPVLAGAAEANVGETIAACEHYAELGAEAVAIVSPFYYRLGPDSVYAYFREIAQHSPIDVTLYNIPLFASPIDVATVRWLAELPRIVGIKDSSGDIAHMMRMIAAVRPQRPDFTFLCGWEAALVPMLEMGCDGGTNSTAGVVPEIVTQMYDLAMAGRHDEARALQLRFLELFDAIVLGAEFPHGLRAAVESRGFHLGASRQPVSEKQPVDRAGIERTVAALLADYGHPLTPSAGAQQQRVERIARSVVNELRRRGIGPFAGQQTGAIGRGG